MELHLLCPLRSFNYCDSDCTLWDDENHRCIKVTRAKAADLMESEHKLATEQTLTTLEAPR
ncbi:MAG: hypothetical protein D6E12_12920 [Desulfovibrio sp.]|nr:MAG: hypothetical protein D6E12_12920 [Desulfovibrio sp.]